MAPLKNITAPKGDKQIKQAEASKQSSGKRITVTSVASVRVLDGACVVVADGVEQLVDGSKAAIIIEG